MKSEVGLPPWEGGTRDSGLECANCPHASRGVVYRIRASITIASSYSKILFAREVGPIVKLELQKNSL